MSVHHLGRIALALAGLALAAQAERVVVRVKKYPKPEYATVETDRAVREWAVDYLTSDGSVWGVDFDTDRAALERRVREAQQLGARTGDDAWNRPSPIYARLAPAPRAAGGDDADRALRDASQSVTAKMREHMLGLDTYRKALGALGSARISGLADAPGEILLQYGKLLGEATQRLARITSQRLDGPAADGAPFDVGQGRTGSPFDIGQGSSGAILEGLGDLDLHVQWEPAGSDGGRSRLSLMDRTFQPPKMVYGIEHSAGSGGGTVRIGDHREFPRMSRYLEYQDGRLICETEARYAEQGGTLWKETRRRGDCTGGSWDDWDNRQPLDPADTPTRRQGSGRPVGAASARERPPSGAGSAPAAPARDARAEEAAARIREISDLKQRIRDGERTLRRLKEDREDSADEIECESEEVERLRDLMLAAESERQIFARQDAMQRQMRKVNGMKRQLRQIESRIREAEYDIEVLRGDLGLAEEALRGAGSK